MNTTTAACELAFRDPGCFLELVKTFDPHDPNMEIKKVGKPFPAEKKYVHRLVELWMTESVLWVFKSRQMLLTWLFVSLYVWDSLVHAGQYTFLRSEQLGQAGSLKKTLTLLSRVQYIVDRLPLDFLYRCFEAEIPMSKPIQSPTPVWLFPNQSILEPISQNVNNARSPSATGCLDDEIASQSNYEEGLMALLPTLGEVGRHTAITTIRGENYPYMVWTDKIGYR